MIKVGIDIGTSYSSIAVLSEDKAITLKIATGISAFGDSYSMPTAVYIDKNDTIVLGQAAYNKRGLDPTRFKADFKRDFGTTAPYLLGDDQYLPETFYTEIFRYFMKQVEQQCGEKIGKAYITYPASYTNNKRLLLEKAANNAGLFDIVLVDEPTAAAICYSQKKSVANGEILLVYDLGGGTFDLALIQKTAKGFEHLTETIGIKECGGIDFDRAIFTDIIMSLRASNRYNVDKALSNPRFSAMLSEISIKMKHQLSINEDHTEVILIEDSYYEYTLSRQKFEELIRNNLIYTCQKVEDILRCAGLSRKQVNRVLLVGGCTRIPLVKTMLQDIFGDGVYADTDPELSVALGAALWQSDAWILMQQELLRKEKEKIEQKRKEEQRLERERIAREEEEKRQLELARLKKEQEERDRIKEEERRQQILLEEEERKRRLKLEQEKQARIEVEKRRREQEDAEIRRLEEKKLNKRCAGYRAVATLLTFIGIFADVFAAVYLVDELNEEMIFFFLYFGIILACLQLIRPIMFMFLGLRESFDKTSERLAKRRFFKKVIYFEDYLRKQKGWLWFSFILSCFVLLSTVIYVWG